ncbi:hypothetical protein EYF80_034039 [Liparis tanakae]|uniref:Uncharacterized protein n=1 Tax=Liparis tanakae TaxID=230148 RepID=A0A4Z2GQT7_9TELE|nr:hypothetical protein EYF80_034039 [Liparis tanakae]
MATAVIQDEASKEQVHKPMEEGNSRKAELTRQCVAPIALMDKPPLSTARRRGLLDVSSGTGPPIAAGGYTAAAGPSVDGGSAAEGDGRRMTPKGCMLELNPCNAAVHLSSLVHGERARHVPSQLISQLVDVRYRQRVSAAAASRSAAAYSKLKYFLFLNRKCRVVTNILHSAVFWPQTPDREIRCMAEIREYHAQCVTLESPGDSSRRAAPWAGITGRRAG